LVILTAILLSKPSEIPIGVKNFSLTISLFVIQIILSNGIQAQNSGEKLDQVSLLKQFTGKWRCEIAKDTAEVIEAVPYGKGFEVHYSYVGKGNVFMEGKQLWGFDSKYENFLCYSLSTGGKFQCFTGKFTTDKKIYWEGKSLNNPEKILSRYDYEFISPDSFSITEGKDPVLYVYKRVK
jgi:hypothetical protein